MGNEKEKPVSCITVGADKKRTDQSTEEIITDTLDDGKKKLSLDTKTLNDVFDTYYYPREPVISNLLYPGTVILAGASKIGKSFLVAEMAYCVAKGICLWNEDYKTSQGNVLYLALEDDLQRIQQRYSRMFGTEGTDALHFVTTSKTMEEGLVIQLTEYIHRYRDTKLIIIDTLQKIRGLTNETISYCKDYDVITQLKNFSDQYGVCILLVHHTRKQDATDCFEKISGTNGLMGSADAAIIMTRDRGSADAKLQITGRDQQEQIINIRQNQETLLWEYERSETGLWKEPVDPVVEEIVSFIKDTLEWQGTASDLINDVGLTDIKPNILARKLNASTNSLWNDYKIKHKVKRSNTAKIIKLKKLEE